MRYRESPGWVVLFLLVAGIGLASAQDVKGRWGAGGFVGYHAPLFKLSDRFSSQVNKYGINLSYIPGTKATIEVEYHWAKFDHGTLETRFDVKLKEAA